jgi:hypothetical protein
MPDRSAILLPEVNPSQPSRRKGATVFPASDVRALALIQKLKSNFNRASERAAMRRPRNHGVFKMTMTIVPASGGDHSLLTYRGNNADPEYRKELVIAWAIDHVLDLLSDRQDWVACVTPITSRGQPKYLSSWAVLHPDGTVIQFNDDIFTSPNLEQWLEYERSKDERKVARKVAPAAKQATAAAQPKLSTAALAAKQVTAAAA